MEDLVIRPPFWSGKRVFITGHTGFKGSWLSLWLQQLGAEVLGYSLVAPTKPSLFEVANVAAAMESLEGDVRDYDGLRAALKRFRPEIVLHLAAQSLVRESYTDPIGTYATNVMGTVHLLEAVRSATSVQAVVVVSSDKCYENRERTLGYREGEAMGGFDPYSSSKGCTELVTAAYRRSFFSATDEREPGAFVASGRAGNVIGGGDWASDRLIPDAVRAFSKGEPAMIRRPDAIRPWQYVLEPLCGYLMLAERLCDGGSAFAEPWNFGPSDAGAQPVRSIVDAAAKRWGTGASWRIDGGAHPHEANYLKLDSSKARARLGWTPRLPMKETIEWTVDWYQAFHAGADMLAMTREQIAGYQAAS